MDYTFEPVYSAYPELRNKTVKFILSDHEDLYRENTIDRPLELETYGWYNQEINYTINSYGFRSDEFESPDVPSIVFLGCSYTFGLGIRMEDSFTHLISKQLGLNNYNLGQCGGGPDTAFRIGHYWIPQLKPKYVVWMDIFRQRCEEIIKVGNGRERPISVIKTVKDNYEHIYLSRTHWDINSIKNYIGVKSICDHFNIKLIHSRKFEKLDLARDLSHPGKMSNEQVAEDILTQIKNRGE